MTDIDLPDPIATYQRAHDRRDTATALGCFAPDASVIDEDQTFTGTERIRWWLDNVASEYTYTRTLIGIEDLGEGQLIVHNRIEGDFPGGQADLKYRFRITGELIEHLEIAP